MNSAENSYCRLCAELKQSSKLLNLQHDESKRQDMVEKLNRINASTDLCEEILPKTVCLECLSFLDRAYDFVIDIEQSQRVLNDIFKEIKEESEDSCSDEALFEPPDLIDENVDVKQESNSEDIDLGKIDVKSKESNSEDIDLGKIDVKSKESNSEDIDLGKIDVKSKDNAQKTLKTSNLKLSLDALPLSQLKLSWKDYSWVCCFCETQFTTVDELNSHTLQYHDTCNAYRCSDCKRRKLRLDKFVIHVKRHRQYLKMSCYKCHKKFSTPYDVSRCVCLEHRSSEYVCPGCNTTFPTSEDLESHTKLYYLSTRVRAKKLPELPLNDDLTCVLCKKTFKSHLCLTRHLLIHTDRNRDHTCDKCGKCFLSKRNLAEHMDLHDNVRPFQCKICKAAFKRHNRLRDHVKVHDTQKPFSCEQCGRCFRLQKHLTNHSIIHTDELPYVCSICNKRFRVKTRLNQHILQHTGVKPYSCEMCTRDFTNWPNYNKHMKRRHGLNKAKTKRTPEGVYPIDPKTGEPIVPAETSMLQEWKKNMLMNKRKIGRP